MYKSLRYTNSSYIFIILLKQIGVKERLVIGELTVLCFQQDKIINFFKF